MTALKINYNYKWYMINTYTIYIYMDSMLDVCYSIYVLGSALSASASATA